jgi:chromosome segregation ATPase
MITSPEASVSLKDADKKKIVLVQDRLKVVQDEVLSATKNLAALEQAIAQAAENKKQYDEVIATLEPEVKSLEARRDLLKEEVRTSETTLVEHEAQHETIKKDFSSKKEAHDAKEEVLSKQVDEIAKHHQTLATRERAMAAHEEEIHTAHMAFLEAIKAVTWQ